MSTKLYLNSRAGQSVRDLKRLSNWFRQYRIVRDGWLGYEAQTKTIIWPFWTQINWCNTSSTHERAYIICERHKNNPPTI